MLRVTPIASLPCLPFGPWLAPLGPPLHIPSSVCCPRTPSLLQPKWAGNPGARSTLGRAWRSLNRRWALTCSCHTRPAQLGIPARVRRGPSPSLFWRHRQAPIGQENPELAGLSPPRPLCRLSVWRRSPRCLESGVQVAHPSSAQMEQVQPQPVSSSCGL